MDAFEKAGILFITDDESAGIGVRLAKKKNDDNYAKTTTREVWLGPGTMKQLTIAGEAYRLLDYFRD